MSVPHTGHLTARIGSGLYQFNGDEWSGPDPATVKLLADATSRIPTTHRSILDLAALAMRDTRIAGEILTCRSDSWDEGLPPGAID